MHMQYSLNGLHLTEEFEGCRTESYPDPASGGHPWTIGYGHTGPEVVPGLVWSRAQCELALRMDLQKAVAFVNAHCRRDDLTQGEFDALVDFAFNCGVRNLDCSTLMRDVNAGNFAAAADEFRKWDRAGGREIAGLLRRRLAEKAEFEA